MPVKPTRMNWQLMNWQSLKAMVPVKDCHFDGCNMGAVKDPSSLFYTPNGPMLVGAVPFEDCQFINCRFSQVAFTGHKDFIENMAQGLSSAAEAN